MYRYIYNDKNKKYKRAWGIIGDKWYNREKIRGEMSVKCDVVLMK